MVTSTTVLIVILAAVMHATWNYMVKTIPGGVQFVWLGALACTIWMVPLMFVWLYFEPMVWTWPIVLGLLFSSVIHLVYFLILQDGYQKADLSVVYPLARGSAPLFASAAAILFLGESPHFWAYIGLLLVATGIVLIARTSNNTTDRTRLHIGLKYGIGIGLMIALYTIFDRYLVREMLIAPFVLEAVSHPLRVAVLYPKVRNKMPEIRAIWRDYTAKVVIFALLSPTAFIMILYALKTAPVHFVAPARELSIVLGVMLGGKLLAEDDMRQRLIGALVMLLGVVLLSV
jgi:drug/metabolite transporter (DMT)-like permease